MATTITLYKTRLSPYDIDRPNDMIKYLSSCDSETVQSNRDMRFERLTEIEIMTSSVSSFDLMDCNYLEIVNTQISPKKWRYFVLGAAYSKVNVATLSLQADPWGCVCDWAGKLIVDYSSFVRRSPKVNSYLTNVTTPDLAKSISGSTLSVSIHYYADGSANANSFAGRGVPVIFADITDSLADDAKTYSVAFFSTTINLSYQNTSLNDQFQFLVDCIKDVNVNGHYDLSIEKPGPDGSQQIILIHNVKIKRIKSAYIVPSYALAGLYNTPTYWTQFDPLGSLLVDTDPINRYYEQFIGSSRVTTDSTPNRLNVDASPLFIGNEREAVRVKRTNDYNGARTSWAMGSDGFTLTVIEIGETQEMHDLTNAITVPNVETGFFNVTTTTETEKVLNRVSAGIAVAGGVAATAGGIMTANPVAVVAGAGTISHAVSGTIAQEKKYKGEGANGYISHGGGVDFSKYHKVVYKNYTSATPPRTASYEIPIITAFTVETDESRLQAIYYYYNGVPVGDTPISLRSLFTVIPVPAYIDLLEIRHVGENYPQRLNFWLFESVSIRVTGGISPFIKELSDMLTTSGVRVWDTSTVIACANFKS